MLNVKHAVTNGRRQQKDKWKTSEETDRSKGTKTQQTNRCSNTYNDKYPRDGMFAVSRSNFMLGTGRICVLSQIHQNPAKPESGF